MINSASKKIGLLIIVMMEKRTRIVIIGLPDNNEIKEFLFENYSFESAY